MKRLSAILMVLILVAAAAGDDNVASVPAPPESYELTTVEFATIELHTNASGSLRPKERTVVPAPISGKVEWVIDEGTRVTKGTEVARVGATEYVENLEQRKLELSVVEAELRRAGLEEKLVKEQLAFEVEKARLELELARLRRSVLGPPTRTDVELSRLAVDQTKFAMDAAGKEHERLRVLGEKGVESGRNIALARLKFERARADHLKAKADHDLLLKGDPAEDIAVAEEETKRAEVNLDLAKKRLKSQAAFQATQVRVAEVAVERVQALIALDEERISSSRVTSPVDGVVYYPRYWGVALRAGDPVWRSNRFLDIADPSVMTVEAIVNQVDWPRVKPGQEVEVRLIAYPDKVFHGVVRQVGTLARDRSLILREELANVMSFHVLVDVKERAPELRPSYAAKLRIVTHRFENCIAVPRGAVLRHAGRDFVWVKEAAAVALRPVKLGERDAVNVVVEGGLQLHDQVLVPRKKPAEGP